MTLPLSTTLPVSLRAVVEAMEMQSDESSAYLHRTTGELILVSHEELRVAQAVPTPEELAEYPQWQHESIENAGKVVDSTDYVRLPSKFDLHEWRMMEQFCHTRPDQDRREQLLDAIRGRGAFRRFKNALDESELQEWYQFQGEEYARVAKGWLEVESIAYQRDL